MFRISKRYAYEVVGQNRDTQRHAGRVADIVNAKLMRPHREMSAEQIRWCRRMAYHMP